MVGASKVSVGRLKNDLLKVVPQTLLKDAASRFCCQWAISIQDALDSSHPTPTPQGIARNRHAHFFFDDIRHEDATRVSSRDSSIIRQSPPTIEDVKGILGFVAKIPVGDRLLIHCWAGRSRSTASAIAIHISRGISIENAFRSVEGSRTYPDFCPNQLIIKHADALLNLDGKLIEFVNSWYDRQLELLSKHLFNISNLLNGNDLETN